MSVQLRGIVSVAQAPLADTARILWDDSEYRCDLKPYASLKPA
jgi:hypothetical protein